MKFGTHTTSGWFQEKPPCKGAKLEAPGNKEDILSRNKWSVEIDSLDELMKLVQEEGPVIIHPPGVYDKEIPEIEIYDDYRE